MLRGLKDLMAIASQLENLPFLVSSAFILMIIISKVNIQDKRHNDKLMPFGSIVLTLSLSVLIFKQPVDLFATSSLSFILISAFSLLLVSQFWKTLMTIFDYQSGKLAYGFIALTGSLGGIIGPALSIFTLQIGGIQSTFIVAFILLTASNVAMYKALRHRNSKQAKSESNLATGSPRSGRNIGLFIFIYAFVATIIYVQQLEIVESLTSTRNQMLFIFSLRDLGIGVFIVIYQKYVFRKENRKVNTQLTAFPLLAMAVIMVINLFPTIGIVVITVMLFKTYNFTVVRPARELFYLRFRSIGKHKNFIDSVVYRAGDLTAVWLIFLINAQGWPSKYMIIPLIPIVLIWLFVSSKIQTQLTQI